MAHTKPGALRFLFCILPALSYQTPVTAQAKWTETGDATTQTVTCGIIYDQDGRKEVCDTGDSEPLRPDTTQPMYSASCHHIFCPEPPPRPPRPKPTRPDEPSQPDEPSPPTPPPPDPNVAGTNRRLRDFDTKVSNTTGAVGTAGRQSGEAVGRTGRTGVWSGTANGGRRAIEPGGRNGGRRAATREPREPLRKHARATPRKRRPWVIRYSSVAACSPRR